MQKSKKVLRFITLVLSLCLLNGVIIMGTASGEVNLTNYFSDYAALESKYGMYANEWPTIGKIEFVKLLYGYDLIRDDNVMGMLDDKSLPESQHNKLAAQTITRYFEHISYLDLYTIMTHELGDIDDWSLEQRALYSSLLIKYGKQQEEWSIHVVPVADDIQEDEAVALAATKLADAFGFSVEFFKDSPVINTLFYANGENGDEYDKEPVWYISFRSPQNYAGAYSVKLSRHGEIIMHQAANSTPYGYGDGDILVTAKPAIPAAHDATAELVMQYAKESLSEVSDYSKKQIQDLSAEAHFIYHERFCYGLEPVWLVNLYNNDILVYKALYGYDGSYMEIIPAGQDFSAILRPGFYADSEIGLRMPIMDFWEMSVKEKADFVEKWKPIYDDYAVKHPYYPRQNDMIYLATRYAYGVPGEGDISQEEATQIGEKAIVALGANPDNLGKQYVEYVFDVTDPANPSWRLFFSFAGTIYHVEINAKSREVTRALEVLPEMDIASFRY